MYSNQALEIISLIALIGSLVLVYMDYNRRNSLSKDPFWRPITLNLPNFVIHAVILTYLLLNNIIYSIYLNNAFNDLKDIQKLYSSHSEQYKVFILFTHLERMRDVYIFNQIGGDLFVQFIFWNITSMSC